MFATRFCLKEQQAEEKVETEETLPPKMLMILPLASEVGRFVGFFFVFLFVLLLLLLLLFLSLSLSLSLSLALSYKVEIGRTPRR